MSEELETTLVLDVREDSEFEEEGHIEGAWHLFAGYVDRHFDRIAAQLKSKPNVAVTCSVGHRAGIVVSLLERRGIPVKNLLGDDGVEGARVAGREGRREGDHDDGRRGGEGVT